MMKSGNKNLFNPNEFCDASSTDSDELIRDEIHKMSVKLREQ